MKKIQFLLLCAVILAASALLPLAVSAASEPAETAAPASSSESAFSGEIEEDSDAVDLNVPEYAFVGTNVYATASVTEGRQVGEIRLAASGALRESGETAGAFFAAAAGSGVVTATAVTDNGCRGAKGVRTSANVRVFSTELKLQNTDLTVTVGGTLTPVLSFERGADSNGAENVDYLWSQALRQLLNVTPELRVSGKALTVSGSALVANEAGTAVVTASLPGTDVSTSFTVEVKEKDNSVPVTTLAVRSAATIKTGETLTLTPQYAPANATNASGAWTLSKSGVVSVSGNVFTALAPGRVTATFTLADSTRSVSCVITVIQGGAVPVTGVTIANQKNIKVGETITLTPKFSPADASNQNGTWLLSAEGIVSRYGNEFTGLAAGTVNAIFQTEDGGFISTCKIIVTGSATVTPAPAEGIESIRIAADGNEWIDGALNLRVDATYDVAYEIAPEGGDASALTWHSSTPSVATVYNGTITAGSPGETQIRVSFGGKTLAEFKVIVE